MRTHLPKWCTVNLQRHLDFNVWFIKYTWCSIYCITWICCKNMQQKSGHWWCSLVKGLVVRNDTHVWQYSTKIRALLKCKSDNCKSIMSCFMQYLYHGAIINLKFLDDLCFVFIRYTLNYASTVEAVKFSDICLQLVIKTAAN